MYTVELPDAGYFERQVSCREACPVSTDAGGYVQEIAGGGFEEAYRIARSPNPMASVCGRICASPCELACRRGAVDAPVTIRGLKRFVCEGFGPESPSWKASARGAVRGPGGGRKAAVVGAGPAGLACAEELARKGFLVTVFEAGDGAGGMLLMGVPEYRLPRPVLAAEVAEIERLGVAFDFGKRLGRDFGLADLERWGYKAVFLAIGAHKSRGLSIDGIDLDGVVRSVDFLLNIHRGYKVELGSKVVVIGGGNVAFDVARSVIRQAGRMAAMSEKDLKGVLKLAAGALEEMTGPAPEKTTDLRSALDAAREAVRRGVPDVHMFCLESLEEMPADAEEIEQAGSEGIRLHARWGPARILGRGGRVQGVEFIKCRRVFDESGRFNPAFNDDVRWTESCQSVIVAIGQTADLTWVRKDDGIKVTPRGTIETDPGTMATSRPGVFAGGDVAFGPRIVITAVAEGRRAARSIAEFLGVRPEIRPGRVRASVLPDHSMPAGYEKLSRVPPPSLPVERRVGVAEVEQVFSEEAAVGQAERCLKCHVSPVFDGDKCVLCGGCADVCPESCLRLVDVRELDGGEDLRRALAARYGEVPGPGRHGAIIKDETRCIRCGLCAERCPTGAITMEKVGWVRSERGGGIDGRG